MTAITFDGNNLQTSSIITSDIDHGNVPDKVMGYFALAHSNRSVIPSVNYPTRTIVIAGKVVGSDIADLESKLDTFRAYFRDKDSNLDVGYNGGTRRYIATLSNLRITQPGGLNHANFQATFQCTQPFGQNTSTTSAASETGQTGGTDSWTHTFLGTAPFQLPVITITLNSVTGGTGHLSVTNDANDQGITLIDQDFQNGDVIVINCKERTVTINGTEVDFMGTFPEFEPGSKTINYEDGFTARNFDISVVYYPMFL